MARSRGSRRTRGPHRQARPSFEALDGRILLSGVGTPIHGKLGPFIAPGENAPRIRQAPTVVAASPAVNRYLVQLLGPEEMEPILAQGAARGVASRAMLHQRVLGQPFFGTILGSLETYELLNAPATQLLVGFVATQQGPQVVPTVRYVIPRTNVTIGTPTSLVQIPPDGSRAGFVATVPTLNVRLLEDGTYQVDVPVDQIPGDAPPPQAGAAATGALADVYRATGPVLSQALLTGRHQRGPNTPQVVRGLRLARVLGDPRVIPPGAQANYLRLFRVAVERNAFQPTPEQSALINDELASFLADLDQLTAAGAFNPPVPPATAPNVLAGASLGGSLQVTAGVVRDLVNVSPGQTGLQLFGLNFPGRIDAGYVIAPNGDYGLVISARGPLRDAPSGFSTDVVGGDVRVEVSNATSLADLNGLRVEEGTYTGSVLSGAVSASRTPGGTGGGTGDLVVLGAAAGFGTGLDYGTGLSYTRVIPLGNLNALLPQYPRR